MNIKLPNLPQVNVIGYQDTNTSRVMVKKGAKKGTYLILCKINYNFPHYTFLRTKNRKDILASCQFHSHILNGVVKNVYYNIEEKIPDGP